MANKNTVIIKNYLNIVEEYVAGSGAIYPGYLVELQPNNTIDVHDVAKEKCLVMVAIEDALQGKNIDQAYAKDDPVRCWIPQKGDQFYGVIKTTSATVGQFVYSNGDGTLVEQSSSGENPVTALGIVLKVDAAPAMNSGWRRVIVRVI